ncbi:cadherin-like domain-containing protein [Limnospira fusiformis PMC 851.14]|uniref:Cadherin-like domain-containing protein n=1 Tax=Limnospira fusiformis PMC 851.14 TaxID=2219512 RepID=A0ABU9EGE8_LIMFS
MPPNAVDDRVRRAVNQPVTFDVLANDSDPEGEPIRVIEFTMTTGGDLIQSPADPRGGTFTYTPNPGFVEPETFTYTITDGSGNTAQATVFIQVNQPPELVVNRGIILLPTQQQTITVNNLFAEDPDNLPTEVFYEVLREPQAGIMQRLGTTSTDRIRTGDRFSQESINTGAIIYTSGRESGVDDLVFRLTDSVATLPQQIFSISVVDDFIQGTDEDDNIEGTALSEYIQGFGGNDTLVGVGGRNILDGGPGNDSIVGGSGNDVIDGGEGNDTLLGNEGNDSIFGGPGNDSIIGGSGINSLFGEGGDDTIIGGDDGNLLSGGVGNDSLTGGTGNDTIFGGDGNDTIITERGDNQLFGDDGNDLIFGGIGRDLIQGGPGNDTLIAGSGNNTIFGGVGNDSILGGEGDDTLFGGEGNDTIDGIGGDNSIFGGAGNDSIIAGPGNDTVFAGPGNDQVFGGDGNDLIFGDSGNDTIFGGTGDDTISGGAGSDLLTGNSGNNVFYYLNPGEGVDIITDFKQPGNDRFLIVSGENNFDGLVPTVGTAAAPLQSAIISALGSEGTDISGRQLIIFQDTFDNIQAVNAALKNQRGSDGGSALFLYRNNLTYPGFQGNYILGFDPDLSDDSLPAFDLAILQSIDPSTDNISTILGSNDFIII